MKENSFASRTVQIEEGQRVISSGPYRLVRHPMYFGAVLMLLFTPSALGSCGRAGLLLVIPLMSSALPTKKNALPRPPRLFRLLPPHALPPPPPPLVSFQEKESLTFSFLLPRLTRKRPCQRNRGYVTRRRCAFQDCQQGILNDATT